MRIKEGECKDEDEEEDEIKERNQPSISSNI